MPSTKKPVHHITSISLANFVRTCIRQNNIRIYMQRQYLLNVSKMAEDNYLLTAEKIANRINKKSLGNILASNRDFRNRKFFT